MNYHKSVAHIWLAAVLSAFWPPAIQVDFDLNVKMLCRVSVSEPAVLKSRWQPLAAERRAVEGAVWLPLTQSPQ